VPECYQSILIGAELNLLGRLWSFYDIILAVILSVAFDYFDVVGPNVGSWVGNILLAHYLFK